MPLSVETAATECRRRIAAAKPHLPKDYLQRVFALETIDGNPSPIEDNYEWGHAIRECYAGRSTNIAIMRAFEIIADQHEAEMAREEAQTEEA